MDMTTIRILTRLEKIIEIRDMSGVLVDPTSLEVNIRKPDGTVQTIPGTDPSVQHLETGKYAIGILFDMQGLWAVNVQSISPTISVTNYIYCDARY